MASCAIVARELIFHWTGGMFRAVQPLWCPLVIRIAQVACIVLTAVALYAIGRAFMSLSLVFSADFPIGFICGALFVMGMYGLICWVDPSSRPRGPTGE